MSEQLESHGTKYRSLETSIVFISCGINVPFYGLVNAKANLHKNMQIPQLNRYILPIVACLSCQLCTCLLY